MLKLRNILTIAGAALAAASLAASANAAVIIPVSAVANSSYGGYPAGDAIDQDVGSDVSDWAAGSTWNNSFLNLDLGAIYTLDQAFVTDRVTSGGGNNGFVGGLYDFTTKFSIQAFTDASFTTALGSALVFEKTAPVAPNDPSDFLYVADLGGLQAQFLQYKVVEANWMNPGLSDIRFEGVESLSGLGGGAVPEPATWAMMLIGFGAMGAMLRRRRAMVRAVA